MKIVVVGNGKVGHALVEQLSKEGHDIVVIDNCAKALENLVNSFDVMGVLGNGAIYSVQMEAGVENADLLIAVTSADEINMLCCLIAKKLGAKSTIARVRNPEYSEQLDYLKDDLGLSMSINPEFAAASEISRILSFPSAMKIETFSRDRVEIVEFRVGEDNPLIGIPLSAIHKKFKVKILICAVQRNNEVIIPKGDFIIHEGDKIEIASSRTQISNLFRKIGSYKNKVKNVMIIGGNRTAYYLTKQLLELGMNVKIIEINKERSEHLSELLPMATVVHGDGTEQEILLEEGLERVDAFVALTDRDEENITISIYAGVKNVPKVITKVNRLTYMEILDSIKIDSIVSPKFITANQIVQYVRAMQNSLGSNVETLHKIVDNSVEALEFVVPNITENTNISDFIDVPLKDLGIKSGILVASIIRKGQVIIPGGDDVIKAGDNVIVVTKDENYYNDLSDIFK